MDIWDRVKNAIPAGLGFLANAFIPGSGGMAAGLISSVLDCDNTPEAIEKSLLNANPEQITALKKMAFQHKEKLIELATANDKLYIQDIQNARQREIEIVRATGGKDYNLYILAWTVVFGFFALVGVMMFVELPDANLGPVNQLFGAMSIGFGVVLQYFFGSSKSSSDKTKLMANLK